MKTVFRRILLVMMVMLLAAGAVMPSAMAAGAIVPSATAAKGAVVSNADRLSLLAGFKDQLVVTSDGVEQDPKLFTWKSSKSKVVSVNKLGVITAKKVGSAVISATRKSNGNKLSITVKVVRNKSDNINSKPSATTAPYKGVCVRLKSVEIVSTNSAVVEYYLCCNFPRTWKLTKIKSLESAINLFDRTSGSYVGTIVGDSYQLFAKKISGFKPRSGKFVQVIKATFSGSRVHCTNVKLSDYLIDDSGNVTINYNYTYK